MNAFKAFPMVVSLLLIGQSLWSWLIMGYPVSMAKQVEPSKRHSRSLINLFSDHHQPNYHTGNDSPVIISSDGGSAASTSENWLKTLHKQTNRVIEGAGDVVMTPVNLLSHMKEYW